MWIYKNQNWIAVFFMSVLMACFALSAQSAPRGASQYSPYDAPPTAEDVAPTAEDVAPAAEDVAPAATDVVPAAEGAVPAAEGAVPAATDVAPAATDAASAATDAAPAATDVAPAAEDAAPAATDVAPAATDAAPAAEGAVPAAEDAAPAATDAAPAATDVAPAATDAAPAATDVAPAATDAPPAATDAAPAAEGAVPAAEGAVPAATDVAPAATDVVPAATDVVPAAEDAAPAVEGAAPAAKGAHSAALDANFSFQGLIQDREFILENQESLFKDYDLDKLLHKIRTVLEHNDLESVKKQFHRLFDKESSVVYSCPADYATLDENFKIAKEGMGQGSLTRDGHNSVADGESHGSMESHNRDSRFEEMYDRSQETGERLKAVHNSLKEKEGHLQEGYSLLDKTHGESNRAGLQRSEDDSLLSPKTPLFSPKTLYKKGYDFILAGNYVKAEKAFCAFQSRYQKDPLSDDALFWLAEALLGQKRYHEAAQVYLNVWYLDKKKLYTSEILLKLAISMVALDHNEEACVLFAKRPKSSKASKLSKTLECVFCKSLKKERRHSRCSLD